MILACPQCGMPQLSHCDHDGIEVAAVDMPVEDAWELRQARIAVLGIEIGRLKAADEEAAEQQCQATGST